MGAINPGGDKAEKSRPKGLDKPGKLGKEEWAFQRERMAESEESRLQAEKK
jgi:hypothetical protein